MRLVAEGDARDRGVDWRNAFDWMGDWPVNGEEISETIVGVPMGCKDRKEAWVLESR